MRFSAALFVLFAGFSGPALAQFDPRSPIPDGRCVLVVASRPSLEAARAYIADLPVVPPYTQVFPSSNGWYAITSGSLTEAERTRVMAQWKAQGRIPQDAFCSLGADFGAPVDWRVAGAVPAGPRRARLVNGRLEIMNDDGSLSIRDLADGSRSTQQPNGITVGTSYYSNVDYIGMPSLTGGFASWVTDVDGRINQLAAEILEPEELPDFAITGRDKTYEDRILFRLQVLEIIAEDRR